VARAQWVSTGIASYSWRLSRQCMCDSAPLVVVVQDGQVATVTLAETGGAPSDEQVELDAATVEELFGWIDDAFAEGRQVRASFDPDLGFPTRVEADGLMPEAGLFMTAEDLIPST
jgi:hypothetical protein